jgi:tetratricopeptide (TPR) repeat protein
MAVFHGGFALEAARAVAGASMAVLSSLVRKSMLTQVGSNRFTMHEMLHQYAVEALERRPHERDEVEDVHAEYYGRYVTDRQAALAAAKDKSVFLEIEPELPNIRKGWEYALAVQNIKVLLSYLRGMHRFFEYRSRFREGEVVFRETATALRRAADRDAPSREALAVALTCLGALLLRLARFPEAGEIAREAFAMATSLGLRSDAASASNTAGLAANALGDVTAAKDFITQALVMWEDTGNLMGQGVCHANLGLIGDGHGSVDQATDHYRRALAIFKTIDHKPGAAVVLQNLAGMALQGSDFDEARRLAEESLVLARSVGDRLNETRALGTLGNVAHRCGDDAQAIRSYEQSIALKRELGDRQGLANNLTHLGGLWSASGQHERARAAFAEAYAEAKAIGDPHLQAMALMFRADHCMELGELSEAEQAYRAALTLALETESLPQATEIVRAVGWLKNRLGAKPEALEAYLVGLAQPFHDEAKKEISEAVAELEGSLPTEVVEKAKATASQPLMDFAKDLLQQPPWI